MNLADLKLPREQKAYLRERLATLDEQVRRASEFGDNDLARESVSSLNALLNEDRDLERPSRSFEGFQASVRTCGGVNADFWELFTESLQECYARAHFLLSEAHIQLGNFEDVIEHATRTNELSGPNAQAYYNLSFAHYRLMMYKEAAADAEKAIQLSPEDPRYYAAYGAALTGLGRHKEAITQLRKAISLNPGRPDPHNTLSYALIQIGEYKQAIASADTALSIDPEYGVAHNNRGRANLKLGNFKAAIKDLIASLKFEPELLQGWSNLGRAYQADGKRDEAIHCYRRGLEIMQQIERPSKDHYLAAISAEKGLNEMKVPVNTAFEIDALSIKILTKKDIAFYLT